jgi:hypothetical protein
VQVSRAGGAAISTLPVGVTVEDRGAHLSETLLDLLERAVCPHREDAWSTHA